LKDLTKALTTSIPTISSPLPDDLLQVINAYLEKHDAHDDSDSQRLQEELLSIYQTHVHDKASRLAPFLAVLRILRPAIRGSRRLLQWWDKLCIPVLNNLGEEKGLATETKSTILELLVYDEDEEEGELLDDARATSSAILENLLGLWLEKSKVASAEFDNDARFTETQIQTILLAFGKKRPKDFLTTIDKFFVKKESRILVLSLVCEFIRHQPPHLHQLLQTPLFGNLLKCLQVDTSTRVISLAMTALVMFLPHIPSSLTPHLPALFNIYSRMLFWDKERRASAEMAMDEERENEKGPPSPEGQWDKLSYLLESDDEVVPELLHYFTFLYGLYPLNFMSYIRKPQRYLRHANFPGADELDVAPTEIRQRSEPFRQVHLLHPNFFMMTIESELTDNKRWMGSEAADVVAECMALYNPGEGGNPMASRSMCPGQSLDANTDVPEQPLLEGDAITPYHSRHTSWRHTQSTAVASPDDYYRSSGIPRKGSLASQSIPSVANSPSLRPSDRLDSPTLPPHIVGSAAQSPRREALRPQKSRGSIYRSPTNDSLASLALSQNNNDNSVHVDAYLQSLTRDPVPRSPSIRPTQTDCELRIAYLHREIQLLRNDLNFERYFKQQHLSHIGQLRRKQIREARAEAETQNLINSNRGLKAKLEEVKSNLMRMKKENEKSKQHSRKWEVDLASKLRTLKEEQKKWTQERGEILKELEKLREDNKNLKDLVLAAEKKELSMSQKIQNIEINLDELERLRAEVDRLNLSLRTYEAKEADTLQAKENEEEALRKVVLLEMQLRARDEELMKSRAAFEEEIQELRERHEQALNGGIDMARRERLEQSVLDSALAASRQRVNEVQNAHNHLLRRYTELQDKYLELKEANDETWRADEPLLSGNGGRGAGSSMYPQLLASPSEGSSRDSASAIGEDAGPSAGPSDRAARPAKLEASGRSSQSTTERYPGGGEYGMFNPFTPPGGGRSSTDGESLDMYGNPKQKIKPQSDIRVYGRGLSSLRLLPDCISNSSTGGVQNIGKKDKEGKKEKGKEKEHGGPATDGKKEKKGGLGIRGIRAFDF
jgi:solute carrier family 25 protein 16